jgi:lysophospholipase L1-like esterase
MTATSTRRAALGGALLAVGGLAANAQVPSPPKTDLERLRNDWAGVGVYEADNARLGKLPPDPHRVVFMGDSITQLWSLHDAGFFAGKPYVNRGIAGQTTPQMLVRFRPDVIDLKPRVVHIMAGTNDIAGNTGPTTQEAIAGNLVSMCELARAHGIAIVLGAVPPTRDFPWHVGLAPAGKIRALNDWVRGYAHANRIVYADYHTPLADPDGGMKAALSGDGVHPNTAGYAVMDPIATEAVGRAMGHRP